MLLRFQKAAGRGNYETGNQAFSKCLRFLTIRESPAFGLFHAVAFSTAPFTPRSCYRAKNGKTVATWKMMVATEGSTATFEFADSTYSDSDPVVGNGTMNRVAKTKRPAAGSHAISGSWQISKMESVTNNALMFTLRLEDDSLSMTNPTGQSYTAKLDGTDAPYKGDPGINSVSVMRLSK